MHREPYKTSIMMVLNVKPSKYAKIDMLQTMVLTKTLFSCVIYNSYSALRWKDHGCMRSSKRLTVVITEGRSYNIRVKNGQTNNMEHEVCMQHPNNYRAISMEDRQRKELGN